MYGRKAKPHNNFNRLNQRYFKLFISKKFLLKVNKTKELIVI